MSRELVKKQKKERHGNKKRFSLKKDWPYLLMAAPGVLYMLVNNYIPMFGLAIAFKDIDYSVGILKSPMAGLKNFQFLFQTNDAFIITRNTVCYNLAFIVINTVVAVTVAVLLNEVRNRTALKFYQTTILLPYLMSMIIVAYLVYAFLSSETGFVNNTVLKAFGAEAISWYSEKKYWPFILPLVNVWKQCGYLSIIYFASIIGIDTEYYEAATIDGASKLQQIGRITMPLLKPTVVTMVLLSIGKIFYSDFGLFYQVTMNSGLLYPVTNTIDTYVYRGLIQLGNISMSSAAGFYQSTVGFVIVLAANLIVRKLSREQALF